MTLKDLPDGQWIAINVYMSEIRFAWRILLRAPLLTSIVILSLGLGIGANTAIFSLLYQVVLRPLPVNKPAELANLKATGKRSGHNSANDAGGDDAIFSYLMFRHLERNTRGIQGVAGFRLIGANISNGGQTIDGQAMLVSGGYFSLLGLKPEIGRLLTPEDDRHGAGRPVAVLSYDYWRNRLGGQTDILHQPLRVNGQLFTVAGVAPQGFRGTTFGDNPNLFVPLALKASLTPAWDGTEKWTEHWVYLFARSLAGASIEQTQTALRPTYASGIALEISSTPGLSGSERGRLEKSQILLTEGRHGHSQPRESAKTPLIILMAATSMVLLIAIANTANLLLARSAQRRKELAIRTALGAGRGSLLMQLLTESMMLSIGGGLTGLLFASWTVVLLVQGFGPDLASQLGTQLDWPVLIFAFGLTLLTGLLCGVYPAWQASRTTLNDALRNQSSNASASTGSAQVRRALVCAQVTISVVLLLPTGLFLKSMVNLLQVDLGMNTHRVLTFHLSPELNGYKPEASRAFFQRVQDRIQAIPGVRNVSASVLTLLADNDWSSNVMVEGYPRDANADTLSMINVVGPTFFTGLGIPLLAGREFRLSDGMEAPKVAIVNQTFARHFFGTQNPIGRRILKGRSAVEADLEIVGVVKDSHYSGVRQVPKRLLYTPWMQRKDLGDMSFYVSTELPEGQIMPQIRRVMKELDPDLPVERMRTVEEQVSANIRSDKMVLQLTGAFAVLATLLAMLGLYGVMAFSVTRRTREIGIRIALGAPNPSIRALVMRELIVILFAGMAIGIPVALALSRFTESLLFGVKTFDPYVLIVSIVALSFAALCAGYVPSRRALRIDPMTALRYD